MTGQPSDYLYTKQSGCDKVSTINDKSDFNHVVSAMKTIGFEEQHISGIFNIIAGILHVGNIDFNGRDESSHVTTEQALSAAASAFQVQVELLRKSLTYRTIKDMNRTGADVYTPLKVEQVHTYIFLNQNYKN